MVNDAAYQGKFIFLAACRMPAARTPEAKASRDGMGWGERHYPLIIRAHLKIPSPPFENGGYLPSIHPSTLTSLATVIRNGFDNYRRQSTPPATMFLLPAVMFFLPAIYIFVPTVYIFVPAIYIFVPAVYIFVPAIYIFVPAIYILVAAVYLFVPAVYTFVPAIYMFVPASIFFVPASMFFVPASM